MSRLVRPLSLLAFLLPALAQAWGPVGHEVICEIAFQELERPARRQVTELLRLDTEFRRFAPSCNWADEPRKRDQEHYVNYPRSYQSVTTAECPLAEACVLSAIEHDIAVLRDPTASDQQKLDSLKFLGHWVGDIHQPLHVTFQDDRGANWIDVQSGFCEGSLHWAWDQCVLVETLGHNAEQVARQLRRDIGKEERARWQFDSPVEWANESYRIATRPSVQYCQSREGACWYAEDNMILQRGEPQRTVVVDRNYARAHRDVIAMRLKQAGVRLGALLNEILR